MIMNIPWQNIPTDCSSLIDRERGRETDRQTDKLTERYRQLGRHRGKKPHQIYHRETHTERQTHRTILLLRVRSSPCLFGLYLSTKVYEMKVDELRLFTYTT